MLAGNRTFNPIGKSSKKKGMCGIAALKNLGPPEAMLAGLGVAMQADNPESKHQVSIRFGASPCMRV